MRKGIEIDVTAADRARLAAIVADRNSPQKHVWRARIILATRGGRGTAEVMRRAGVSKPCVWRWQERFMTDGVDGLLRDKTRPARIPPLPKAVIERVVTLHAGRAAAGRRDPLDGAGAGRGQRAQRQLGAADLAGARPAPPSGAQLQALDRSQLRRQGRGHRRAVRRSAGARRGAVDRRKEPDPGARPHPTGPAAEEGPRRDHDPSMHVPRWARAFLNDLASIVDCSHLSGLVVQRRLRALM